MVRACGAAPVPLGDRQAWAKTGVKVPTSTTLLTWQFRRDSIPAIVNSPLAAAGPNGLAETAQRQSSC